LKNVFENKFTLAQTGFHNLLRFFINYQLKN
jgi:hypothetical protein